MEASQLQQLKQPLKFVSNIYNIYMKTSLHIDNDNNFHQQKSKNVNKTPDINNTDKKSNDSTNNLKYINEQLTNFPKVDNKSFIKETNKVKIRKCPKQINQISNILEEIISNNNSKKKINNLFLGDKQPTLSLSDQINRLQKYTFCSDECQVLALILMDRFLRVNTNFQLNKQNSHRFLLIALIIGIKYHSDSLYKNDFQSRVGGISVKDLNLFELNFLVLIDWRTQITSELYQQQKNLLDSQSKLNNSAYYFIDDKINTHPLLINLENCQKELLDENKLSYDQSEMSTNMISTNYDSDFSNNDQ